MTQYALVFDKRCCIGCRTCVIACRVEHNLDGNYSFINVLTTDGAVVDLPRGTFPDLTMEWEPITCMQCQNPSCVTACPDEAIARDSCGVVLIDKAKCTGCRLCLDACPYEVIHFNKRENVAEKCDLCRERTETGSQPFCVRECAFGAIHFGDISDKESEVSQKLRGRASYVLKPEVGTEPSNRYLG
ncbi:MAG: 4Fe-4S dicluster domain-containing protein [Chloroflexi bacterium]|nr:4Fe-4S dicluster domain-containing protein [Chloroflexota bacterium]